jgi:hypothetical protein
MRWPVRECWPPAGQKSLRQKNRMVRNPKPDGPISLKIATTPSQQHEQWAPKDGSSADESGSSRGQIGLRSETSANEEAKPNVEKGPEMVEIEQSKVPGEKGETKIEDGTSL